MKPYYLLRLMRPEQWYKNLLVFVPLIFAQKLLNLELWPVLILGFVILCFISSISYIINDVMDMEADKKHPKKRNRPLASGKVSKDEALLLAFILTLPVLFLSYFTNYLFWLLALGLFLTNQLYSLYLKNIPIIDVHLIALGFIIRTEAGNILINLPTSPWLLIIIFLLSLFWAVGKRKVELATLKSEAPKYKKVFKFYTEDILLSFTNVLAAMLLLAYIFFTSSTHGMVLMLTIPIATFMVFRYLYFIYTNKEEAQKSERIFLDPQMFIALVVWVLLSIYLLYWF